MKELEKQLEKAKNYDIETTKDKNIYKKVNHYWECGNMTYSKQLKYFIDTGLNVRKVAIALRVDSYINFYDININEKNFNIVCEFIDKNTIDLSEDYLSSIVDILFTLISNKKIKYTDFTTNINKVKNLVNTTDLGY